MALAILELLGFDKPNLKFRIDTGTNRYYQLKVGSSVRRRYGIDWVDDVVFATPMAVNQKGGSLLDTDTEISVPVQRVESGKAYVQLFTFKSRDGRAPAFSRVVGVPMGPGLPGPGLIDLPSLEMQTAMGTAPSSFQPPRRVACRTYGEQFSQAPLVGDLLTQIVQIATPVVLDLLGAGQSPSGSAAAPTSGHAGSGDGLAGLVAAILRAIPGVAGPAVSGQQSLAGRADGANRFSKIQDGQLSRPFVFGIDDAILGALVGQVVQVLPQLMNSANQKRVQLRQANNKLVADILSDVNRRMLLEQVLQAQRQTPVGGQPANAADLNQIMQLLQQLPATTDQPAAAANAVAPAAANAVAPAAASATSQSLSADSDVPGNVSSRAVLSFVTADPVPWNGASKLLFARNQPLQLRVRLVVMEPVPKTPLAKAIIRIVFKDRSDESVLYEKTVKHRNVPANGTITIPFESNELSQVPANEPIALFAELRWLGSKGTREYKALGSSEITLVNRYFVKERGPAVGPERELTDMNRFRPFWNKVWEAPPLDAAYGRRAKKYLWELDVNGKYSVLLSPDHEANGLMDTKLLQAAKDENSIADRTEGRMKAGIELSIAELNKLAPLWDGEAPLDPAKVDAFRTVEFARANGSELVYHFKLKGRAGERGMVWVIPVFQPFEFTLGSIERTDDAGQIVSVAEEKVHFPLPVAARAIGLKSR